MANVFTTKNAANGQVANTKTTIYTASSVTAYRPCVTFFNTNAATQTITLYYKASAGTSRSLRQFSLAQFQSAVFDERLILNTGDVLEAVTTTASAVDYTVSLTEEA